MAWSDQARKAAALARKKGNPDSLLTSLYRHFPRNPMNPREIIVGKAVVQVTKWNGGLSLDTVRSLAKGKGYGSRALKVITRAADRNGLGITLMAKTFGKEKGALSQKALVSWYDRHGFKKVEYDERYRAPKGSNSTKPTTRIKLL